MKNECVIVEIRSAEGGDDAKSLICKQYSIYTKIMTHKCL